MTLDFGLSRKRRTYTVKRNIDTALIIVRGISLSPSTIFWASMMILEISSYDSRNSIGVESVIPNKIGTKRITANNKNEISRRYTKILFKAIKVTMCLCPFSYDKYFVREGTSHHVGHAFPWIDFCGKIRQAYHFPSSNKCCIRHYRRPPSCLYKNSYNIPVSVSAIKNIGTGVLATTKSRPTCRAKYLYSAYNFQKYFDAINFLLTIFACDCIENVL